MKGTRLTWNRTTLALENPKTRLRIKKSDRTEGTEKKQHYFKHLISQMPSIFQISQFKILHVNANAYIGLVHNPNV